MSVSSTRLYAVLARKAPIGVIFRRGPSNQVQLLKWNLETDEIIPGQWLKGRVYEHRCDLSPNGDFLVYFAATYKGPYSTWTAISRPPFFSALALWPKGDAWGGGGLFDANGKGLALNHRSSEMKLAQNFKLPSAFRIRPLGEHSGWGEDDPILSFRLKRDGWVKIKNGEYKQNKHGSKIWIEYLHPEVWEKKSSLGSSAIHMELHGIHERNGSWYLYKCKKIVNDHAIDLGRCDWADINSEGVVYFSNEGCLYRKHMENNINVITDLSDNKFSEIIPTEDALTW